jgi:hypothetical protein
MQQWLHRNRGLGPAGQRMGPILHRLAVASGFYVPPVPFLTCCRSWLKRGHNNSELTGQQRQLAPRTAPAAHNANATADTLALCPGVEVRGPERAQVSSRRVAVCVWVVSR